MCSKSARELIIDLHCVSSQDKLAELKLQHTNLQELLGALKDDPAHSAVRLTEWHSKLGELRLKEMKIRENERCVGVGVCGCECECVWMWGRELSEIVIDDVCVSE